MAKKINTFFGNLKKLKSHVRESLKVFQKDLREVGASIKYNGIKVIVRAQVVRRVDTAIHWITQLDLLVFIRWIVLATF